MQMTMRVGSGSSRAILHRRLLTFLTPRETQFPQLPISVPGREREVAQIRFRLLRVQCLNLRPLLYSVYWLLPSLASKDSANINLPFEQLIGWVRDKSRAKSIEPDFSGVYANICSRTSAIGTGQFTSSDSGTENGAVESTPRSSSRELLAILAEE